MLAVGGRLRTARPRHQEERQEPGTGVDHGAGGLCARLVQGRMFTRDKAYGHVVGVREREEYFGIEGRRCKGMGAGHAVWV